MGQSHFLGFHTFLAFHIWAGEEERTKRGANISGTETQVLSQLSSINTCPSLPYATRHWALGYQREVSVGPAL